MLDEAALMLACVYQGPLWCWDSESGFPAALAEKYILLVLLNRLGFIGFDGVDELGNLGLGTLHVTSSCLTLAETFQQGFDVDVLAFDARFWGGFSHGSGIFDGHGKREKSEKECYEEFEIEESHIGCMLLLIRMRMFFTKAVFGKKFFRIYA